MESNFSVNFGSIEQSQRHKMKSLSYSNQKDQNDIGFTDLAFFDIPNNSSSKFIRNISQNNETSPKISIAQGKFKSTSFDNLQLEFKNKENKENFLQNNISPPETKQFLHSPFEFLFQDNQNIYHQNNTFAVSKKAEVLSAFNKKSFDPVIDEVNNLILEKKIIPFNLLNGVGAKLKKKIDYIIKDSSLSNEKHRVFEATCTLEGDMIGWGKGNSKKNAKIESATQAILNILTQEQFFSERNVITVELHKIILANSILPSKINSGNCILTKASKSIKSQNFNLDQDNKSLSSESSEFSDSNKNESILYDLNLIAKECFIRIEWKVSLPAGPNGDFEAHVKFDNLIATGKGKRKNDARREAAQKILKQIKRSEELGKKYNPKLRNKSYKSQDIRCSDQSKKFFENFFDSKVLVNMQAENQNWKKSIIGFQETFDEYLLKVHEEHALDDVTVSVLLDLFKQVSNYTDIITSNIKQTELDTAEYLVNHAQSCFLVPAGSFAFDCMRKSDLSINAFIVFEEKKDISESRFLETYCKSLIEYQDIVLSKKEFENIPTFIIDPKIESSSIGEVLVVTVNSEIGPLKLQIQAIKSALKNLKKTNFKSSSLVNSLFHIHRVSNYFNEDSKLNQLKKLMCLMRIWRKNTSLSFLNPELLDIIIIENMTNCDAGTLATSLENCLSVMISEETFEAVFSKFGEYYKFSFQAIPSKLKWKIFSKCNESLEAIHSKNFEKSYFA